MTVNYYPGLCAKPDAKAAEAIAHITRSKVDAEYTAAFIISSNKSPVELDRAFDIWFSNNRRERIVAREICNRCEFFTQCREDAIARKETHGIWGGVVVSLRERGAPKATQQKARRVAPEDSA